jgi:hypothetical protein
MKTVGSVANFRQDSMSLVTKIPRLASSLPLVVIKSNGSAIDPKDIHLKVNRNRVRTLANFFINHNPFWKANGIKLDNDAVEKLPSDGVPTELSLVEFDRENQAEDPGEEDTGGFREQAEPDNIDEAPPPYKSTFIDHNHEAGEEEKIRLALGWDQITPESQKSTMSTDLEDEPLPWPVIEDIPVNEFTTEGIFSLTHPTLFPLGIRLNASNQTTRKM